MDNQLTVAQRRIRQLIPLATGLTTSQERYASGIVECGIAAAINGLPPFFQFMMAENMNRSRKCDVFAQCGHHLLELGRAVGHAALLGNLFVADNLDAKIGAFEGNFSAVRRHKNNASIGLNETHYLQKMLDEYAPNWVQQFTSQQESPTIEEYSYKLLQGRRSKFEHNSEAKEINAIIDKFIADILSAMLQEIPRVASIKELMLKGGEVLSLDENGMRRILEASAEQGLRRY